ncbi:MLP-like protein 423 [Hibiscus trionum]|uniref:MLP-like protein 423 n=1 Tax=Hibiscus trionum TaxID=183268 RepID=A0A9W7M4Q3_HIBTR|nr:MLP-like protein 423 [Hibiscus trionum]
MACTGKLEVEIDLKSPADKVWSTIRDSTTIFPIALSHDYKSIEVLEGDGKSPGTSVSLFMPKGLLLLRCRKRELNRWTKRKRRDSSLIKWSCDFEKASEDIPDPSIIKDFAVKNFVEIDDYLQTKA